MGDDVDPDTGLVAQHLQHRLGKGLFAEDHANLVALQQLDHVAQLGGRRRQSVRRLDDARHLQSELLEQVAVTVVHRHDPGDLGLSELLCGPRLDEAEPAGVLRRVALKRFGVLGPQCGEGFLDGVGLLDGVGERNKRMGVHALPVHEPDLRCGLVGADDNEFRVAGRLDHGGDEVVVADAVHDNGVEIDDLLDVVGPGLVIAGVNLAR